MAANCITVSRILLSLLMLAFPPGAFPFAVSYLLCGATDVLDGFVARKLYTESEKGAMLDSMADLLFSAVYAVKILPLLNIPLRIGIWIAVIAVTKITGIVIVSKRAHKLLIGHSFGNKFTGLLLFLLPVSTIITDAKYGEILICIAATVTVIKEITTICRSANTAKGKII